MTERKGTRATSPATKKVPETVSTAAGRETGSKVTAAEFLTLIHETIPVSRAWPFEVVSLGDGRATLRIAFREDQLRAGGTISGPTLMTLADTALYAAVLSRIGLEPLAVTSDLTFRFLRKPAQAALLADATLLRAGKRLVVGEVQIRSEGSDALVTHVTGTYALP
jgi:uncharacterized protein (TIGR00369 family)